MMDYGGKSFAIVGQATPDSWMAMVFIRVFAETLGWLPTPGKGSWQRLVMSVMALTPPSAATLRWGLHGGGSPQRGTGSLQPTIERAT